MSTDATFAHHVVRMQAIHNRIRNERDEAVSLCRDIERHAEFPDFPVEQGLKQRLRNFVALVDAHEKGTKP